MFAQLDTKTVYSFLDSLIDLDQYIEQAQALGYETVGIMDKDNLYAGYHFIKACHSAGIRPVLGLELDLIYNGRAISARFLAKDTTGYHQLIKLSSQIMQGWSELSDLATYLDEHIAIIIPYVDGVEELDLPFEYFIGVDLSSPQIAYSKPLIPLYTVRYFRSEDKEALQVLHAIRDNQTLAETEPISGNEALMAQDVMTQAFAQRFPESLSNLQSLVSSITYTFNPQLKLPRFNREIPAVEELAERAYAGLAAKSLSDLRYQQRLQNELDIIHEMGFDDYFLIVWDLLRFGRSQGYYMGMGRGSAAGSLVAYALDITGIDPVKNQLLFERFLNKERYSMPDIDIDLPDIYRPEFLHYVRERYGTEHAAQIVTFSTFGAKQAIRDVFKRFGAPEYDLSNLSKKISFRDTLKSVYEKNMAFRQIVHSRPEYEKAFGIARKIEGQPRQTSIHAAGIVMSDDNLTDHIPVKSGEEMLVTQYDAGAVEANGLLKMDFLGLRNLTFVQKMQEKLAEEQGVVVDISKIDLEDADTLALFAKGQTKGIFQFEQPGAINLLRRIKPARFEEVVATTSLNRPGASDYIDNFVKRKFGQESVDLIDPLVAPILEPTYGIMLYQEQVMQIAQVFAGFSLGKADLLRRAMSKKNHDDMQKMEADFMSGALQLGRNPQTAQRLFQMMAKFAGYGFNRSHAFAYSALAFQMGYFKAHHPSIFYDIMLNYSSPDYLTDALEAGFKLDRLSINTIPYTDKIFNGLITLGMRTIKALPRDMAYWIIESRPFASIEDFLERLPEKYKKPELIEPLVDIGLFDEFQSNRQMVATNLESLLVFVSELGSLFADSTFNWRDIEDYSTGEKYQREVAQLGIGISPHPLKQLYQTFKHELVLFSELVDHQEAKVLGQIESVRTIRTKSRGEQMAFLKLTDGKLSLDVTLFPESYEKWRSYLEEGQIYFFTGRIQERNDRLQMILTSLSPVVTEKCWIQVKNHDYDQEISQLLSQYRGAYPVILHYVDSRETLQSQTHFVEKSQDLIKKLEPYVLKTVFR
ncbi:DNA polymerase III subunit alpha [Streptococcus caprae]|uniref:DNA polymerase III subunit alpha n=1 Tax=Streptococcus caprae TaxID=1640501 RepID=A0ABV8CVF2_9STRE